MSSSPSKRSTRSTTAPGAARSRRGVVVWMIGYLLLIALMGAMVVRALTAELEAHSEQANRQFTRMFANDNWERLKPLLRLGASAAEAKANPSLDEITGIVRRFARGTELVAVKIFNAQGLLLYATDRSLIGADRSRSPGFLSAVRGQVTTELIHRDVVSGFDGDIHQRDLVASYVPVRTESGVEAVVEVYTDRTAALDSARGMALRLIAGISLLGLLGLLPWLRIARRLEAGLDSAKATEQALRDQLGAVQAQGARTIAARERFLGLSAAFLAQAAGATLSAIRATRGEPGTGVQVSADLETCVATLSRRAEQIDALARLEAGLTERRALPFALGDLIRSVGGRVQDLATQAQQQMLLHVAPATERVFLGDPQLLEQSLGHLLDLAVQRTAAGGSIHLRAQPEAQGVIIDVLDTGAALTEEQMVMLGEEELSRGSQADVSRMSDVPIETDIRLRLAAGMVKAMGGRLTVQTSVQRGTSIHIWLPLRQTSEPSPGSEASAQVPVARDPVA